MTLILRNVQKVIRLNIPQLREQIELFRKILAIENYDVAILCVDDRTISGLNSSYRGEDEPTDVLAFPFNEISVPGQLPLVDSTEDMNLGDIVLGIPYIHKNSQLHKDDFEQIVAVTINHGLCHLLGYDHDTRQQWKDMYKKEMEVLEKFNKITGYCCRPLLGIGH